MTGREHKHTLIKHGTRHSCRIDETVQLQVTTSHHQHGMQSSLKHVSYIYMQSALNVEACVLVKQTAGR